MTNPPHCAAGFATRCFLPEESISNFQSLPLSVLPGSSCSQPTSKPPPPQPALAQQRELWHAQVTLNVGFAFAPWIAGLFPRHQDPTQVSPLSVPVTATSRSQIHKASGSRGVYFILHHLLFVCHACIWSYHNHLTAFNNSRVYFAPSFSCIRKRFQAYSCLRCQDEKQLTSFFSGIFLLFCSYISCADFYLSYE